MKVILREDVQGLGYKNDTVTVKPGYGRNFLIPKEKAIIASPSNRKKINEEIRQAAHKAEKFVKDALSVARQIGDLTIEIKTKASSNGRIFGAITPIQVSGVLLSKGFSIDRKKIHIENKIKELGKYPVILHLHKEVQHTIQVEVVNED